MARRVASAFQGDLFQTDAGTGYVAPPRELHGSVGRVALHRLLDPEPAPPPPPDPDTALADFALAELVRRLPKGAPSPYVRVLQVSQEGNCVSATFEAPDGGPVTAHLFDEPNGWRYSGDLNLPWGPLIWRYGTCVWERAVPTQPAPKRRGKRA